uniref:Uncharacterized protein n=1 Tax=Dulem virus 36 TaxID=3145754 RepID=A0AAU8AZX8_9CAUD
MKYTIHEIPLKSFRIHFNGFFRTMPEYFCA